jgi:DNA polymerase III subunit alpha
MPAPAALPFAHLHVHSDYSVLDGACRIERLLDRVEEIGQGAVALTDHGVMSGAVELYRKATARGITPVVGLEAYVVPDHAERPVRERRNHLTLLAETTAGYYNLIRLCSAGYLEGYHRKPRISHELMARHADGIIALSGCRSGVVCGAIEQDDVAAARAELDTLAQIFGGDDVFVEVQHAGVEAQTAINAHLRRLAADAGLPMVATCDAHYPCREDADAHEALLAIQTRDLLSNPNRFRFDTKEFYLKTGAEMAAALPDFPDAIAASVEVAERCTALDLPLGDVKLPRFPVPDGQSADAYLERLCRDGLAARYPGGAPAGCDERLRFELGVIAEMGFASYFLIVWDYMRWARENGVAVGPGRGSAAGSLVAYALRIVDLDPLAHDLLFERFLNPGRKSMPDIDTDFSVAGRDRVVQYVTDKYGPSAVARIGTFGKLLARAVVRDAGRVLGHSYGQVDRIAKLVPERPIGIRLEDAMKPGTELAQAYAEDPVAKEIIDTARPLEGLVRNEGVHAAGVVIAPGDITDYLPVRLDDEGNVVTQVPDHDVESLGLLKMDFLGLRNLDVIQGCLALVERRTGAALDIETVPLDDAGTYQMLARGDAIGVFQFESSGMREALREVGPTEFADLIALVALYRPGPMAFISTYARNKREPERVTFEDPRLEPITGPSYGVAVYQEQLMAISRQIAGFSPARADDLRKAVGKKDKVLMASLKDEFVSGCLQSGTDARVAGRLWSLCEAAGDYSFNKSHAACYALLAYRTAYLKANHPAEYMAALLSTVMDTKDRVPFYVAACAEMGLAVLPPDVNLSGADFAVTGPGEIRFGLTAVKGVGENAVAAIIAARDAGGPFESIWDFCRRVDQAQVNKRALESLIRGGALDSTGATRRGMLEALAAAMGQAARRRMDLAAGQESLFAAMGGAAASVVELDQPIAAAEMPRDELLAAEKEALGLYVSSHPLSSCRHQLARAVTCGLAALVDRADGEAVTVGGILGSVKHTTTRRGEPMMFARLDDLEGSVEVVVVPAVLADARELLAPDATVLIAGRVDQKGEGETKLVAQAVRAFLPEEGGEEERLRVRVPLARLSATPLDELRRLLADHRGDVPVVVEVETGEGPRRYRLGEQYRVDPRDNGLVAELKTLFGERCLA